jgi:hypothetical protein
VASASGYAVSALGLRPSNLLSVSAFPCAAHIVLYTSMFEASERTQSTNECVPKGEAGCAPLTKAIHKKKCLLLVFVRFSRFSGSRIEH